MLQKAELHVHHSVRQKAKVNDKTEEYPQISNTHTRPYDDLLGPGHLQPMDEIPRERCVKELHQRQRKTCDENHDILQPRIADTHLDRIVPTVSDRPAGEPHNDQAGQLYDHQYRRRDYDGNPLDKAGGDEPKQECRNRELDGDERKDDYARGDVGVEEGLGLVGYGVGLLLSQAERGC